MIKSIPDSGTLGYLLQIIRYLCRFLPKRHSFVNIDILISKYYQIVGLCLDFFNQLLTVMLFWLILISIFCAPASSAINWHTQTNKRKSDILIILKKSLMRLLCTIKDCNKVFLFISLF